jgi:site-specific recombinase XerD
MNYLETEHGQQLINQYLSKLGSNGVKRVYKSEVSQFFNWHGGGIEGINKDTFMRYRDHIGQNATAGTLKRKFSILNNFFRFVESQQEGYSRPIGEKHGDLQAFQTTNYVESDLFKRHMAVFENERLLEGTKNQYQSNAEIFFKWAGRAPNELTQMDFVKYRDYMVNEGMKPATIWNKFISLNRFFKLMAFRNPRFKSPLSFKALGLVIPHKDSGYYDVMSEGEIKKLLGAPDRSRLKGKRDYLILRLLLVYGLRIGEICKLRWRDVDRDRPKGKQRIWIRDRKGRIGKREDTPIILEGRELEAWDEYITECGIQFEQASFIFVPFVYEMNLKKLVIDERKIKKGNPRTKKTFWNMLDLYLRKSEIEREGRRISPHALRHTCFTVLAHAGCNVIDIKKLAAHKDISTTMIYMHTAQSFEDHIGMKNPISKF